MFWGWEGSPSPRAPKSLFPRVPSEPREGPCGSSTLVGPGYSESEHSGVFPRTPFPPLAASDLGRRSGVGGREEAKQRDAWTAWTATEEEQLWPPLGSSRARAERARAPRRPRRWAELRAGAGGASGGRSERWEVRERAAGSVSAGICAAASARSPGTERRTRRLAHGRAPPALCSLPVRRGFPAAAATAPPWPRRPAAGGARAAWSARLSPACPAARWAAPSRGAPGLQTRAGGASVFMNPEDVREALQGS